MSRYSRLLELSDFSTQKLEILQSKKVLVIGVGGVGQHVLTYLATNGIKHFTIVDFDKAEPSNLNRQILLKEDDQDLYKVEVVKDRLIEKNSTIKVRSIILKVDGSNIDDLIDDYDVVIDALDNWKAKLVVAKACKKKNILLLHIGVDGYKGQYCLFKNKSLLDLVNDDIVSEPRDGVMGPMVGVISSMASILLIRYLVGDSNEVDTLFYYDAKENSLGKMKI